MNNLIINGIDHSKFDLEWAKRGGVVLIIMDDSQLKILANLAKYVGEWAYFINATRYAIPDCELYFTCGLSGSSDLEMSSDTHYVERMATPSECAEAGIEYIEPPARWLPINTLTTDIPVPLIVCDKKSKERGVLTGENIFGGACISGWNDDNITPTHWMPLPQPQKDK